MKAIVVREFGPPEVMQIGDVPLPEPAASQVVVKIHAAGINPVDTYIRSGTHAVRPELPYTPGNDAAGVVESVGADVSAFKPGDRVYTAKTISGSYAEYALCDQTNIGKLPDNVSFEQGAGVFTPYATSFRALFQKAGAKAGESVLIHGASGGVGVAATQWARAAGLKVFGTAGSPEGRELVLAQGADHAVDHTADGYLGEIRELNADKGVDVIIEMLANVNLEKDFDVLEKFGRIVVVGNRGSLEFTPRLAMGKDAVIYGMALFNASDEELSEIRSRIFDGLSSGSLRPVVRKTLALSEAVRAHHEVIEEKAYGKIVLVP